MDAAPPPQAPTEPEAPQRLSAESAAAALQSADDKLQRAKQLRKEGDLAQAAELLGTALRLKIQALGDELALECAPLYHLYGDVLLEQVEKSGDFFGSGVVSKQDESDSDADEGAGDKAAEGGEKEAGTGDAAAGGSESDAEADEKSKDEGDDDAAADDMRVAFENLDVARVIYEKHQPAHALDLSDVLVRLGDLNAECDRLDDAIADYRRALDIRAALDPPDPRAVAETHHMLATAYSLKPDHDGALQHYTMARDTLAAHAQSLRARAAQLGPEAVEARSLNREAAELESLVQELTTTIDEMGTGPSALEAVRAFLTSALQQQQQQQQLGGAPTFGTFTGFPVPSFGPAASTPAGTAGAAGAAVAPASATTPATVHTLAPRVAKRPADSAGSVSGSSDSRTASTASAGAVHVLQPKRSKPDTEAEGSSGQP